MSSGARRHRKHRHGHGPGHGPHDHAPLRPALQVLSGGSVAAPTAHPEVVHHTPAAARLPTAIPVGQPPMVTTRPSAKRKPLRWVFATIAIFVALVGYAALNLRVTPSGVPMNDLFGHLERDYRIFGMEKYLEGKASLRMAVARGLNENIDSINGKTARNIATYMFPELLSDDNFEKAQAQEFWGPIERAIEQSPKTDESRRWVEELRATLSDYEGVGRGAARLSPHAETTLRLYEALSEK